MLRQYKLSDYRFRLILWVAALAVLGILIIGSANSDYQIRQIQGLILGIAVMVVVSLFDYTWILFTLPLPLCLQQCCCSG